MKYSLMWLATLLIAVSSFPVSAETHDWENEQVIGRNKLPGRVNALPYPTAESATLRERKSSPW